MDTCGVGDNNASSTGTATTMDKQVLSCDKCAREPETLGSVTHSHECEGSATGLQIRSSARVSKKLRLDSTALPLLSDKKESLPEVDKPEPKQVEAVKPKRRPWELWSIEDKNTFFEALNEFGKDFDAIQNHFASKARRKGVPEDMIKNKDQVRHFYYRTWHKISKHLKFNEELQKATQEVYALINYGELRKRIGCVTEKTCLKLNELMYRGSTQIRIRGKTLRVKTPLCRALRKLNQLEDVQEDLKLPSRVFVELRPKHMEAWCRVQAASQNPCVRTLLPLQRRLASLLDFLQQRWRLSHLKHRDKLLSSVNSGDLEHSVEDYKKEKEALLHVAPSPNVEISLPTLNLTEYLTSSSLSLAAHEERLARGEVVMPLLSRVGGKSCSGKKSNKRQKQESVGDKRVVNGSVKQKENSGAESEPSNCVRPLELCNVVGNACDVNDKSSITPSGSETLASGSGGVHSVPAKTSDINDMAVNNILSLQYQTGNQPETSSLPTTQVQQEDGKMDCGVAATVTILQDPKAESPEDTLARIRRGWTVEDANAVTIGELYLMFGCDSKLQLEYWWENSKSAPQTEDSARANPVAVVLQKLISIAKLNYRKSKLMCPCGHVCGAPAKSSVSSRSKVPPKSKVVVTTAEKNGVETGGSEQNVLRTPGTKSRLLINKVMVAPNLQDGVFRRPLLAPSQYKTLPKMGATDAFKAELHKFRPRYCNRRGRSVRPKGVVVQRMLPLLPKAPNGHAMVTLKVIPQTSQLSGEFMPISFTPSRPALGVKQPNVLTAASGLLTEKTADTPQPSTSQQADAMEIDDPPSGPSAQPAVSKVAAATTVSPPITSPPNMSHFLDLGLPAAGSEDISLGGVANGLLDVSLPTSTPTPSFVGLLPGDSVPSTPPTSPSRILKENDNQWLNSEVADFSLSSFLGHLESPLKTAAPSAGADDTRLSSDVEAQLQCLMSENSVDYMAKFADLAAQIASDGTNRK